MSAEMQGLNASVFFLSLFLSLFPSLFLSSSASDVASCFNYVILLKLGSFRLKLRIEIFPLT